MDVLPEGVEDVYELTPLQEGILFHALFEHDTRVYFEQVSYEVADVVDRAVLERAWRRVSARHTALRTAFFWRELDQPLQVVRDAVDSTVAFHDWRELSPAEQTRRLEAFLADDRAKGFELSEPPLARLAVFRISDTRSRLALSFHHLILDGWSVHTLTRELHQLYDAEARGTEIVLPPARPFHDFVSVLRSRDASASREYWADLLQGCLPARLDASAAHATVQSTARYTEHLSPRATAALLAFAQQQQITLHALLCGAWALFLSRYTGSRDVVFGIVDSGRGLALDGIESMVGLCLNTLPVRVRLSAGMTLAEWLRGIHAQGLEMIPHAQTPLVDIRRAAGLPADEPLFDTLLTLENYPGMSRAAVPASDQGASSAPGANPGVTVRHSSNYALSATIVPEHELSILMSYDPSRCSVVRVAEMASYFRSLLEILPEHAQSLVRVVERRAGAGAPETTSDQVEAWHGGLPEEIAAEAARRPDAVAVTFDGQAVTYEILHRAAMAVTAHLQAAGVEPDAPVGICFERSIELVAAILGILYTGAAYVPLDPEAPRDRLADVASDAALAYILTSQDLRARVENLGIPHLVVAPVAPPGVPSTVTRMRVEPEHACYVLYTSGSTGRPKGVVNVHGGLHNRIAWMQAAYALQSDDVVLQKTPFTFDVSAWEFLWTLRTGARLVMARPGGHRDANYLGEVIEREQVTTLHFVPSMLEAYLAYGPKGAGTALRRVACGGEAMTGPLAAACRAHWPHASLHNLYGPTEASIDVTSWTYDDVPLSGGAPIGRPIWRTQVHVLDAEQTPVPADVLGELYLAGVGLARGYLSQPGMTAGRFVPDPYGPPGSRMYRTGDLGRRRSDGLLEYVGRIDSQVKVRGFRIELGEIEAVARQHAGVREVVVMMREGTAGQRQLVAYLVGRDRAVDHESLKRHLRTKLPEYMLPAAYVDLEALPVTTHGKVNRAALPAVAADPVNAAGERPARTPVEELLADIWAGVLGRPHVGLQESFFDIGGDSILAIRLMSRINAALGVEIPLRTLFERPTIAALAEVWGDARGHAPANGIPRAPRSVGLPMSSAQQGLWFLQQLDPGGWAYNVIAPMRLEGALDAAALEAAINALVARHDILRTAFEVRRQQPAPIVHPPMPVTITVVDLSDASGVSEAAGASSAEARTLQLAEEAVREPFDLRQAPLLRVALVRLAPERHVLLLTMHHIVTDAWSTDILMHELSTLYTAFAAGQASPLDEPPLQYGDFAAWQSSWLTEDVLAAQLEYWRQHLDGAPGRVNGGARGTGERRAATHRFSSDNALTRRIDALSQREGVTPFMVLLAAFGLLLRHHCDQDDLVIGSPLAGRTRAELERIVGPFVNTLPLRLRVPRGRTFADLLRGTREICLGAYANCDIPFDRLVQELRPERDGVQHPFFQIVFTFQNVPQTSSAPSGLRIESFDWLPATTKYELVLNVWKQGERFQGSVEYTSDRFDGNTIARMFDDYLTLLGTCCADPDTDLDEINLLRPLERDLLSYDTAIPELSDAISLCD